MPSATRVRTRPTRSTRRRRSKSSSGGGGRFLLRRPLLISSRRPISPDSRGVAPGSARRISAVNCPPRRTSSPLSKLANTPRRLCPSGQRVGILDQRIGGHRQIGRSRSRRLGTGAPSSMMPVSFSAPSALAAPARISAASSSIELLIIERVVAMEAAGLIMIVRGGQNHDGRESTGTASIAFGEGQASQDRHRVGRIGHRHRAGRFCRERRGDRAVRCRGIGHPAGRHALTRISMRSPQFRIQRIGRR